MAKNKRDPMKLTKGKDMYNAAIDAGAYLDRVNGDHYILKGSKPGSCTIPYRDNNMPIKTRKSIIAQLFKIGIVLTIIFAVAYTLYMIV